MKRYTRFCHECKDGIEREVPFEYIDNCELLESELPNGGYLIAVAVRDQDAPNPVEEFDMGELVFFRNTNRDPYNFGILIRANQNRVFYISEDYYLEERAYLKDLDGAFDHAGYYIVPDDVPPNRRKSYAKGVLQEMRYYRDGEVYGLCYWTYNAAGELEDRDECWGFYGSKYATKELTEEFKRRLK